jgi:hypothetical protein
VQRLIVLLDPVLHGLGTVPIERLQPSGAYVWRKIRCRISPGFQPTRPAIATLETDEPDGGAPFTSFSR